ncbi:sodium/glutamate symporter [Shewanella sp. 1_MG-2023]|uniref:sodium/glutamate symporter n=1 Tax=unclassified Shewanella TaxID=196818 RepID=UPI000C81A936|nr:MULTISPECIES: sodium/glutamate symporter [unclassified Shewanella]MDO6613650.1 sodium/glutamate symporter [Shewanella sp. 7_MG-2023]MDO6773494.1 sodium/glutamate symporter [Shewanella sp. 2_MG-2023]MDO6796390.1 sodium/glutamate symporter [Shewanella sp. 1_MG-2023]PMG75405.1 sodium/glutamate symporter [Shewanella sp. 10N.286.51.B7]
MEPQLVEVKDFVSFTLAIITLFIGKGIISQYEVLRKYSIPEPVVGGFFCAIIVGVLYYAFGLQIEFNLEVRDILLLYFFAGIGLKADFATLIKGGKPLLILLFLSSTFIILQNVMGVSVASLFGLDPKAGLMSGSISLIGGVGTAMAWTPTFVEELGITNASELGIASNTLGLIAACVIGGPIAAYLMKRHKVKPNQDDELDIGASHQENSKSIKVDYFGVLRAWLWLNVTLIMGYFIDLGLQGAGLKLPMFVACLLAGIIIGNVGRAILNRNKDRDQTYIEEASRGLSLIQDICLGMFLTMALMSLKIWELEGSFAYISVVMTLQVILSVVFTIFVVFRMMGKDYEAAVICSGFGGVTLGSTATAIVNMTAVSQQYGAAHRAFIIVPLVCGFFIDIINAMIINMFVSF